MEFNKLSMHLKDILDKIDYQYQLVSLDSCENNPVVSGIAYNSKNVKPGDLFVCMVGENFDAHRFAEAAVSSGAVAVLAQKSLPDLHVPVIMVDNTARAMALISAAYYDYPSSKMRLIGITGTNGKTTVTHLVEKILEKFGKSCGLIGTLGNRYSSLDKYIETKHTTPQSSDLHHLLNDMLENKLEYTVMEVSSHALDLYRVLGCSFSIALLTNVTQDHLDFHVTMENYANAKVKLFESLKLSKASNKFAVLNLDDSMVDMFIDKVPSDAKLLTYGINSNADIKAENINYSSDYTEFDCQTPQGRFLVRLNLKGQFSVYNALAAIAIALAEKVPFEVICEALYEVENIPGRFEAVSNQPLVIVDYAHTPDGLSNVLLAARKLVPDNAKLITVFGCGGDRDPTKRPKMAKIVEELSDKVYVTSDNPRTEDPQQIITDILTGIKSLNSGFVKVEIDRASAIEMSIAEADLNDVIVVAGKGHEDYQILADRTIHFDDREVVRDVVKKLSSNKVGINNEF